MIKNGSEPMFILGMVVGAFIWAALLAVIEWAAYSRHNYDDKGSDEVYRSLRYVG